MTEYIVRRLLQSILVLFLITIVTFILIHAAPGGPTTVLLPKGLTAETLRIQAHNLGLDQPIYVQYLKWLGNLLHGNFGYTFKNHLPIGQILWPTVGNTMILMGVSWILTMLFAIPWGVYNSTRVYKTSDNIASFVSYLGLAMPHFWFGLLLQEYFSMKLNWLPLSDMYSLGHEGQFSNLLPHMVLPVTVLTLTSLAGYVKYSRASMLEVLHLDYVRTARAKGVSERSVIYRHALRNALIPIVTIFGLDISILVAGAAITESVFNWPGMGRLFIDMAGAREYSVLMAITIVTAVFVIAGNLIADILLAIVDPRIQLTKKGGVAA